MPTVDQLKDDIFTEYEHQTCGEGCLPDWNSFGHMVEAEAAQCEDTIKKGLRISQQQREAFIRWFAKEVKFTPQQIVESVRDRLTVGLSLDVIYKHYVAFVAVDFMRKAEPGFVFKHYVIGRQKFKLFLLVFCNCGKTRILISLKRPKKVYGITLTTAMSEKDYHTSEKMLNDHIRRKSS